MIKPKLNIEKWNGLFKSPPTKFETQDWGVINFRKEFIQSLLIDIKDLSYNAFDNVDICYRGEGRGKSKFSAQKEYVRWYLLTELELINYDWILEEIVYYTLSDYMRALILYMDEPFRILILDESDELKRLNWNKPLVKSFISYLRRGRKFFKILNLNIPNLKDLPLDIVTDRANKLYEIQMGRNFENFEYNRGDVKMFEVPRADGCWSFVHKNILKEQLIKDTISNIHRDVYKSFVALPNKIKCLDIQFNNVFPFDEEAYEDLALKKTSEYFNSSLSQGYSENDIKVLNMIFEYLASNKLLTTIFMEDEPARRAYYRLKHNVNKVVG